MKKRIFALCLACCWENTPAGKVDVLGFFGNGSATVILTAEW